MRLSHLLLSMPVLFIVACSSPTPPKNEVAIKEQVLTKEKFTQVLGMNFRGQINFIDDRAVLTTCENEQTYTLDSKAPLMDIYRQINPKGMDPVYIEFTGEIVFSDVRAIQPDALIRVDNIHHMALTKNSLQCAKPVDRFMFKAKSDHPYWRLNINDQNLFFAIKKSNQAYQVQSDNFQTKEMSQIKSVNDKGQRLNLTIKPEHCFNLHNKEYWGYSAHVVSIWGKFDGCGEAGWPEIEQDFSGYYLNKSTSTSSDLTLNDDYTVEYKAQAGSKVTILTGFWKSNSPDRVIVMLTREDNLRIQEELIFIRQGLTLTTHAINKNNVVIPLPKKGLTFNRMNSQVEVQENPIRTERALTAEYIPANTQLDSKLQSVLQQYFKDHRTDPKQTKFNSVKYDLNGDGIKDAIVLLDWCSKSGCEMLIFKGTKTGYLFSSRIPRVEAPIIIAKTRHYLWHSLLIKSKSQWLSLNFDGISYPGNSNNTITVDELESKSSGVILFADGLPKTWFPIKE